MTGSTVVLVHGAWHGAWCWDRLRSALRERGVASTAPDLASTARGGTLADDIAEVRAELDRLDGGAVLVGHSRGGFVINEAGDHPAVRHLGVRAASMSGPDEPTDRMAQWAPPGSAESVAELYAATDLDDDGRRVVKPERATELFFHDCAPEVAAAAAARLRPQPVTPFEQHVFSWQRRPTTYVVCSDDRAMYVPLQRHFARRASAGSVEMATSHSPFLSRPDEVAGLLATLAADA